MSSGNAVDLNGKKKRAPVKKDQPSWGKEFVQCHLGEADKAQVREAAVSLDLLIDAIENMVMDGYKITLSYAANNDAVGAYCSISDEQHVNYPYMLVGRGPTACGAMASLVYKHNVMLDSHWGGPVERTALDTKWD